jgi:hypothetical protein
MTKSKGSNSSSDKIHVNDSGRGLPTTATSTPMPPVKPPKTSDSNK